MKKILKHLLDAGITAKIVRVAVLLLLVVAVFIGTFFPARQESQMTDYLDEQAQTLAQTLAHGVGAGMFFEDASSAEDALESLKQIDKVVFTLVLTKDKRTFAAHLPKNAEDHKDTIMDAAGEKEVSSYRHDGLWITHAPVRFNGDHLGELVMGTSLADLQADVSGSRIVAILVGLAILILGSLVFAVVTMIIIRPIKKLEQAAVQVADGDIEVAVAVETNDEVGRLSKAFNSMVEHIRHSLQEAQQKGAEAEQAARSAEEAGARAQQQQEYLSESVEQLLIEMDKFAGGDLTVSLDVASDDDIGRLYDGFNKAVQGIREMLVQVDAAVDDAARASSEIRGATESLAASAQEQSAQADEVAASVEEMVCTIIENAKNASRTAEVAEQSGTTAASGGEIFEQTVGKIRSIAKVVAESAETVENLGRSSQQIGAIVEVIDEIADQTNLLALNAAIEAARAGDQGRGFAVVADEVRKLAERTTGATQEIAQMIKQIQYETQAAVGAMQRGHAEVEEGIRLSDQAGKALREIVSGTQETVNMISQIAAASEEQSATSEQISRSVEAISTVSTESARGIGQIAYTAEGLGNLTNELRELVERFTIQAKHHAGGRPPAPRAATPGNGSRLTAPAFSVR